MYLSRDMGAGNSAVPEVLSGFEYPEDEELSRLVRSHFGLDVSEYSFTYIAGWARENGTEKLRESIKIIHATTEFLELFFENLLMDAGHELKNRYMHIDYRDDDEIQSATATNPKCKNCTLEELAIISEIIRNPAITQKELAAVVGKSERTIKTRTVEMQEKGLIGRENGKRNGRWIVLTDGREE